MSREQKICFLQNYIMAESLHPGLVLYNLELLLYCPGLDLQSPGLGIRSPGPDLQSPGLGLRTGKQTL